MITEMDVIGMSPRLTAEGVALADVIARRGTRVVLLAGSRDPNAKMTLVLLDEHGPAFAVKIPTTNAAAEVIRAEGDLLTALSGMGLGRLDATLPRAVGYVSAAGRPALVTTALLGVPMTVRYHAWRHTARFAEVRSDFAAAGSWLAELQRRTAGPIERVTFLDDMLDRLHQRFPDHPGLSTLRRRMRPDADRLAEFATARTVVHGDYWLGNLLITGDRVTGVVDWEAGEPAGEPLRDVARFAVSYALYLDRHTRPGGRVRGHRGLRADRWGAGLAYAVNGTGWFPGLVRAHVVEALQRLHIAPDLWRTVLLAGVAEIAATADHPEFAREHLDLLISAVNGTAP